MTGDHSIFQEVQFYRSITILYHGIAQLLGHTPRTKVALRDTFVERHSEDAATRQIMMRPTRALSKCQLPCQPAASVNGSTSAGPESAVRIWQLAETTSIDKTVIKIYYVYVVVVSPIFP